MNLSMKVLGIISLLGTIFMATPSTVLATNLKSSNCSLVQSHDDGESEEERSHSTARALFKYVEKYWDIAISKKPERVSVSRVEDPSGDGSKLDLYNVQFRSFVAGFYRYSDGTSIPTGLSTTSVKFDLPCGLKVGQSQKQVRAALGEPTQIQQESFIYGTGGDQNGEIIFSFKRGKLSQVAWAYDTH